MHAAVTADGNGITYNERINIAVAVAMPDGGLITPVLQQADKTDIYQLSRCAPVSSFAQLYCLGVKL